jgi:hypothetical protein
MKVEDHTLQRDVLIWGISVALAVYGQIKRREQ